MPDLRIHMLPRSARRALPGSVRRLLVASVIAALAAGGSGAGLSCRREEAAERLLWTTGGPGSPLAGLFSAGGLAVRGKTVWAAYVEEVQEGSPRIRILHLAADGRGGSAGARNPAPPVSFAGESPALGVAAGGGLVLVDVETGATGESAIVMRRGSPDGRTWSEATRISTRRGMHALANGRLVQTTDGTWIVPAVWRAAGDSGAASEVVCYASQDGGGAWRECGSLRAPGAADPAIAEIDGGKLLMLLRQGTHLARSLSADGGRSWSQPEPLGIETHASPPALVRLEGRGRMALAWTAPEPGTTMAPPGLQELCLALSADGGRTWRRVWPLALRAGRVPASPALAGAGSRLVAFFEDRRGESRSLACVSYDLGRLERQARLPAPERARGRYALDDEAARDALRLLSEHTVARPAPSMRLFIEGYYMRALVAAHEVLGPFARERGDWIDTRAGLLRAISFADWMAGEGQNESGYWPLGYKALYVADMAAAAGLFAALEPHVDEARRKRYEQAATRFVAALERDGMLLASGACGVGWPESRQSGPEARADRGPYLVSTALAGLEVQAWLYRRSGRAEYRRRALAALDYTLSRLRPDGSLDIDTIHEGAFAAAAYVEEGWMAADLQLGDDAVRARLRRALPAHVDWLLGTQHPDGTWDSGADGEFARTPAIIDFLIWYDQRCQSRADVRRAVRRASQVLLDPERWPAYGLYRTGKHEDVLRAIAGRPLAALAGARYVP